LLKGKPERAVSIDLGACSKCGGCIEVAPEIFRWSESGGYVEVRDLATYDPELVNEAIKWCPENCIYWEPHE
jgi:ferredoxin